MTSLDKHFFHRAIARHSSANPNAVALQCGSKKITWSELEKETNKLAAAFQKRNIVNQRIATLIPEPIDYIITLIGTLKANNCFVPLPLMVSDDAVIKMLEDSGSSCLIFSASCENLAKKLIKSSTLKYRFSVGSVVTDCESYRYFFQSGEKYISTQTNPTDECNLIYSSGTTGTPKGILLEVQYRANQISGWTGFDVTPDSKVLITPSLYSNWSLSGICATLTIGGTLLLPESFKADHLLQNIVTNKPTHLVTIPIQMSRILDCQGFDPQKMPETVKICAGSPFSAPEKSRVLTDWPNGGLVDLYGATEGGARTILKADEYPEKLASIGRPYPGMEHSIKIIDDNDCEVAQGETGEIVGFNKVQMKEYINLPEETEKMYWYDKSGQKYIRSGDVGHFDEDGFLFLSSRKKDMIISGGMNIYANDLESVLLTHPDVSEAAVIGVPSKKWGESPFAYVVAKQKGNLTEEIIKTWANDRLGKVQRIIGVKAISNLPRNNMGKVIKQELRDHYLLQNPG